MQVGRVLKVAALALMLVCAAALGMFAAGYALDDPGGWRGVAMVVGCAAVTAMLAAIAARRADRAGPVLAVFTLAAIGTAVADAFSLGPDRNAIGPVGAVTGCVVAVGLSVLGLRRPTLAGALLVTLSLASFGVLLVARGTRPDGPPVSAILTSSAGIGLVPVLVVGILFLVAGTLPDAAAPAGPAHERQPTSPGARRGPEGLHREG